MYIFFDIKFSKSITFKNFKSYFEICIVQKENFNSYFNKHRFVLRIFMQCLFTNRFYFEDNF